jgi:hypothetical protein
MGLESVVPAEPARWTERVECDSCGASCWMWDAKADRPGEAQTCYGNVSVTGSGDDADPYVHFCDNPAHREGV